MEKSFRPGDRLINIKEVVEMTGIGRSTIYELMKRDFPSSIQISTRAVRWSTFEIQDFLSTRPRSQAAATKTP